MTEKKGGSDVTSATETLALEYKPFKYKLFGLKWFTSATESELAITLARIYDPITKTSQKSLTCFIVKLHKH
jgi:alkylation response protein AidB-like acyl-CoA dehydrogenase